MNNEFQNQKPKSTIELTIGETIRINQPKHPSFNGTKYNYAQNGIFAYGRYENDKPDTKERLMFFPYQTIWNVEIAAEEERT